MTFGRQSTLSFLVTMSVTLVLRRERPRLWSRTKEHLRYFHPIATIATCEERFFRIHRRVSNFGMNESLLFSTHRAHHARGKGGRGR